MNFLSRFLEDYGIENVKVINFPDLIPWSLYFYDKVSMWLVIHQECDNIANNHVQVLYWKLMVSRIPVIICEFYFGMLITDSTTSHETVSEMVILSTSNELSWIRYLKEFEEIKVSFCSIFLSLMWIIFTVISLLTKAQWCD